MIKSFAKTAVVIASSTILATLAVNAVDMSGYFSHTMLGALLFSVEEEKKEPCPENMVLVTQALTPFCIDAYEVSAGKKCTYTNPTGENETVLNLANRECAPVSEPNSMPWRFVTMTQAEQACSRAQKRLPTANEWYKASLGTPDQNSGWTEESCNVAHNRADGVSKTASGMRCISDAGAYDMVGNVWEWVAETVDKGVWDGRVLPMTGFVQGVDVHGIAYTTESAQVENFGNDRFWLDSGIYAGVMRGGYYNSQGQAGLFSTYAASPPTFSGDAVGFRCVVTPNNL
jgi:formylglycine-generating enzyme required for sulfatase activity